jgi:REase_MTES_1575
LDSERLAKILEDPEQTRTILEALGTDAAETAIVQGGFSEAPDYIRSAFDILTHRHSTLVTVHTESPIERIWLNSLQSMFLRNSAMLLTTPPIADFPAFFARVPKIMADVDDFLAHCPGGISGIEPFLDQLVTSGRLPADQRDGIYEPVMEYGVLPFREAFHLTLQAGFPKTKEHKRMRLDALIWHPKLSNLQVAIECDGYEFHSDKDTFTSDRQRDRHLSALGVQVFRFSRREIYADPVAAVVPLYDLLFSAKNKALVGPQPGLDSPPSQRN